MGHWGLWAQRWQKALRLDKLTKGVNEHRGGLRTVVPSLLKSSGKKGTIEIMGFMLIIMLFKRTYQRFLDGYF